MLTASDAGHSLAAHMVRGVGSRLPATFNGDLQLYGLNLFLMSAFTLLGALMVSRMTRAIWRNRGVDHARAPVTIWRLAWACAGSAAFLRCGTEAMTLWAWNPHDVVTTARVLMAKRWIDPASLVFAAGWMALVTLSDAGMTEQLRKQPFPIPMLASLPSLQRPLAIILLSLVAAVGVAATR